MDYEETFSPVVCHSTVRIVSALAAANKWSLRQLDMKNAFLHRELQEEVFLVSDFDTSQFVKYVNRHVVIMLLYVDDIIITGSDTVLIQQVIDELGDVFEMKDMGKLTFFLRLQITYKDNGDLFISQSRYAKDLIKKAGTISYKASLTPCKPYTQLLKMKEL